MLTKLYFGRENVQVLTAVKTPVGVLRRKVRKPPVFGVRGSTTDDMPYLRTSLYQPSFVAAA